MSLTSTILLNLPIRLPAGKPRFVSCDDRRMPAVTAGQIASARRNEQIRLTNIKFVFNAIKRGKATIIDITEYTRLSESTVKKALHELLDKDKVTRDCKQVRHRFAIKGKA